MAKDTKNFKVSEFACKHCGKNEIDQRVLNAKLHEKMTQQQGEVKEKKQKNKGHKPPFSLSY